MIELYRRYLRFKRSEDAAAALLIAGWIALVIVGVLVYLTQ